MTEAVILLRKSMDWFVYDNGLRHQRFKRQSRKMVKHTQTIRRQFADELFESVWTFCEIGA